MIRILSIETSCDETALSVIEADGGTLSPKFRVLGNAISSQSEIHAEYGGVFPAVAKREHSKIITELLGRVLTEANILSTGKIEKEKQKLALEFLAREEFAKENLEYFFENYSVPKIDLICVTAGPGLEPALWVGVSFAKALATAWKKPIIAVNHMEGHIASVLLRAKNEASEKNDSINKDTGGTVGRNANNEIKEENNYFVPKIVFPAIALLVSGGHTEIHEVRGWNNYKILGATVDDAIGEAFDKTARLLGLPYPGGPKISALAKIARDEKENIERKIIFPRPMIATKDFNFSYSGLKTAVLYLVRDIGKKMNEKTKRIIAREFEDSALEVVIKKTLRAVSEKRSKSIIVGGGVSANNRLRELLTVEAKKLFPNIEIYFPERELSTDNSLMIAIAGYFSFLKNNRRGDNLKNIRANGNLKISEK